MNVLLERMWIGWGCIQGKVISENGIFYKKNILTVLLPCLNTSKVKIIISYLYLSRVLYIKVPFLINVYKIKFDVRNKNELFASCCLQG